MHYNSNTVILCAAISATLICVRTASVYDQSQIGKLNVQVDLKDLNLFAILKGKTKEEYVDYDYAYDYSEMTIKPHGHKNTTTTTTKPQTSTNVSLNLEQEATSAAAAVFAANTTQTNLTTELTKNITTAADVSPLPLGVAHSQTEPSVIAQVMNNNSNITLAPSLVSKPSNTTNCRKGFVANQSGNCEIRLQGTNGNALLKLVKLSQKLKLRRENKD